MPAITKISRNARRRAWWNEATPSGKIYRMPTDVEEITAVALIHSQMGIDKESDPAERPPNPTWKMIGILLEEIDRLNQTCIEWFSVDDAIPGRNATVMAYDPNDELGFPFPAFINDDGEWAYYDELLAGTPNVTHWHYAVIPDGPNE